MLYYILPPIIIVISAAALIVFLFRKADQVPLSEMNANDSVSAYEKNRMKIIKVAMGQFFLKSLERLMHKSKLVSLKFHNSSNDLFHSIREKRQHRARVHQEEMNNIEERVVEKNDRVEVVEPVMLRPAMPRTSEIHSRVRQALRPMVRETVAVPRSQKPGLKLKDQLEEALIKRIAVNPKDIEAYERLGDYYMESGSYQDSMECFKQVLKLSPTHYKAKTSIRKIERLMMQ